MGMFDGILGGVIGARATTLLNSFIENQGGLQNIASQFEKNGFGDTIKSWISQGRNLPITADQIQQALGSEKVKDCLLYTSPSPRDRQKSRMPSSA